MSNGAVGTFTDLDKRWTTEKTAFDSRQHKENAADGSQDSTLPLHASHVALPT